MNKDNGASLRDRAGRASHGAAGASPPSGDHPLRIWRPTSERPEPCSRVVVLYEDGSGAFLGFWTGESLFEQEGEECTWYDKAGSLWAYLPSGFELWCEVAGEDPYQFPLTPTALGIEAAAADETRSGSAEGESPTGEAGNAQQEPSS